MRLGELVKSMAEVGGAVVIGATAITAEPTEPIFAQTLFHMPERSAALRQRDDIFAGQKESERKLPDDLILPRQDDVRNPLFQNKT